MSHFILLLSVLLLSVQEQQANSVRLYPYLLDPRENPDYERYAVPHPAADVFGRTPQFATLRTLHAVGSELVNYTQLVDKFCLNPNTTLGGIIWPRDPTLLFSKNYADFISYVASKGLFITSVHGFSPVTAGFRPPKEVLKYLDEVLGSRWFGMANGEQDGHYFDAFIRQELPQNKDSRGQYLNFREYFKGMENILGPRMTTLLSSVYPHYEIKSGLYTIAGAETSQHGPNAQLRYCFIRGAGKQYGVLWFGNVSVYNRWGHKVYSKPSKSTCLTNSPRNQSSHHVLNQELPTTNYICSSNTTLGLIGDAAGPTCGSSLNLMKRLMYAQIMYNSGYVSFEDGWFYEDEQYANELTPIGLIQHNAYLWTQKFNSLGIHVPTAGLYIDFFNGWAAPRQKHGYEYHVWYNLPYSEGDFLTDGTLRMVYPFYQDASYFHNEAGVSSATPYGDCLDVLLSDAPGWVLKQYNTLIVSSNLNGGLEVESNLKDYLTSGGHLVLTVGNLVKLPNGSLGVTTKLNCLPVDSGAKVYFHDGRVMVEKYNMSVCDVAYAPDTKVLAHLADSTPLVVQLPAKNGGSMTVFTTPFAISSNAVARPSSEIDVSLPSPYPLLDHARVLLDAILTNATLFTSTANLSLVPTYIDKEHFHLLVTNPQLKEQPLKLLSPQGIITSVEEIPLDQSEKGDVGYLPDGFEGTDIGNSTNTTIAGGDTRLFKVSLSSDSLQILPKVQPKPRPKGVALHLRKIEHSIRYEILLRPTFFQHYDSVMVDYAYLISKDDGFLKAESEWLRQQNVSVYIDASPSVNLFPTLRLTNDAPDLYYNTIESLTRLLYKMNALGACDLIMSLHAFPSGPSHDQSLQDFNNTLHFLNNLGSRLNITVHMLDTPKNPLSIEALNRWLLSCNLSTVQLVLNAASLVTYGYSYKYDDLISSRSSLLYVDAPGWDRNGVNYALNVPLSKVNATVRSEVEEMLKHVCTLRTCPYQLINNGVLQYSVVKGGGVFKESSSTTDKHSGNINPEVYPFVMDAVYANQDEEYADVNILETLLL